MGKRLSVIVTRTGDDGTTGLGDGSRTGKDTLRVAALGEADELNSAIGVLLAEPLPEDVAALLARVQHDLFDLGAELSIPGHRALHESRVAWLDDALSRYNGTLAPLAEFILPGGARPAALAHVARTACRRAERTVVSLHRTEPVAQPARQYLNRLSDLLFVLARVLNRAAGREDVLWQRTPGPDPHQPE